MTLLCDRFASFESYQRDKPIRFSAGQPILRTYLKTHLPLGAPRGFHGTTRTNTRRLIGLLAVWKGLDRF
ncbi:hypothetical protein RSSM_03181 [Rhodopirellula sallentina SM41]|uniref:Uncharacterized protein n=1 Tax=Rhodopirellula sallentina SM41 TaxID=1263870 RepID=M5U273_9BACT|nr:hypothetical protein RSSM_03181 [Rhodopirellula sallentina SM41]